MMNVSFNLATPEIEKRFLTEASAAGFSGLAGHRSVAGIRASIYNALTLTAVEKLADFMEVFQKKAVMAGDRETNENWRFENAA